MKGTFKTLKTFKKLEKPELYVMDYDADYNLDKLLAMESGSDEEFAKNVCKILLNGLPVAVKPEGGCSTFTATTYENESLFARNFDYRTGMPMVIRAFPKRGLKSVSLSNLGHIGFDDKHLPDKNFVSKFKTLAAVYSPIEGMNEKGFAVAVNTAVEQRVHQQTGKTPVMTTCAIRLLLDNADDVEEGIDILKNVDMNSSGKIGYHFHMADRRGNSAVVEKNGTGFERYEILEEKLNKTGAVMSAKESMSLLDAAQMDGHKYYEPGHMYYDSKTQWSVVYNLNKCTTTVSVKTDYKNQHVFNLSGQ